MSATPLTRNITSVYRMSSDLHRVAGMEWYADANRVADALAVRYGVTLEQSAGVIAALSPLNSWGANVNLAGRFLAGTRNSGYLAIGLRKGRAILAGQDPETVLKSLKVGNFYRCIISAGETDAICVDRHAYSLAHNERITNVPSITPARYATIAETYRRAAKIISREEGTTIHPAQLQAITWKAWRARYWAEGAWDTHNAV